MKPLCIPRACAWAAVLACAVSTPALAQGTVPDSGDTGWIITATALVLFMCIPALALFYGGLVRAKNILSVFMHCVSITALGSVLWMLAGYSLAFTDGGGANSWIGGIDKLALLHVTPASTTGRIPEFVYIMFQMTFAVITPALIVGAYPERVKFSAVLLFSGLWLMLVYVPAAHWVWGGGWLAQRGVMDFAGGIVVHTTAGLSALVFAIMLGKRTGFSREMFAPHRPGYVFVGAAMLWVGWFGFNAGSALAANGAAGLAMINTHLSAASASLVWMTIEWVRFGKPSLVGLVTGSIAGLATITPGAGMVAPSAALLYGALASLICFGAVQLVKQRWKIDDSLDVFAVHGVGGILGTLLTGIFAATAFGGTGLAEGATISSQLTNQALGVVAVGLWSSLVSIVLVKLCAATVGLRVDAESEYDGLDVSSHSEHAYDTH